MKTVDQIKAELKIIEHETKVRLDLFIKENPNISINMDFSTESSYFEYLGRKTDVVKEIKSELRITID